MSRSFVLPLRGLTVPALLALAAGCSGASARPVRAASAEPGPSASLCQIQDRWTAGSIRAPRGGFELASIWDGDAQASLERIDGALQVSVLVRRGGWSLRGRLDPSQGDGLRARSLLQLGEAVWASAGTEVSILDARPGAIAVGPSDLTSYEDDGVHFVAPVGRWVPCAAVGLAFQPRDARTVREERRALGVRTDTRRALVRPGVRVPLSSVPGGAPVAELAPVEEPLRFDVVEERERYSRVLLHHWTGTMLVGWVPTEALSPFEDDGGVGGILGGLASASALRVCTSPERLAIAASQGDGPAEPVGTVEAGTRFVLVTEATEPGGAIRLRPHPADSVYVGGEDVRWTARPSAPLSCADETHDPGASLGGLLAPASTYTLRATVVASSGAAAPATGSECTGELEHLPSAYYPCRLELRCGERVVYGHRATNGAFECELSPDVPSVRGRDEETSARSGDGAMGIDTAARSLVIDDDDEGPNGELHIELRIDAFEVAAGAVGRSR